MIAASENELILAYNNDDITELVGLPSGPRAILNPTC